MAVAMVSARSCAEIPVEIPSRASIDCVNAGRLRAAFERTMNSSRSSWARACVSVRQIKPRPCLAMKLMASGVAIWAGITRSPSFSRSSASTSTTMRPLRTSSRISGTEDRNPAGSSGAAIFEVRVMPQIDRVTGAAHMRPSHPAAERIQWTEQWTVSWAELHEPRDIAREKVDLEIDLVARSFAPPGGPGQGQGNEIDAEAGARDLVDRERGAVERNRALAGDERREVPRRLEDGAPALAVRRDVENARAAGGVTGAGGP